MKKLRIVIISGLSGSGKSTAVKSLEDIGFFCIDNFPLILLEKFLDLCEQHEDINKIGVVIDIRERKFLNEYQKVMNKLKNKGYILDIIFLESSNEALIRRFKETRRRHPLNIDGISIIEGINKEREALKAAKNEANWIIDTSDYTPHELRKLIQGTFVTSPKEKRLILYFISFGYKFGIPRECDYIFDCRFLPNPFFNDALREKTGLTEEVKNFLFNYEETQKFLDHIIKLLEYVLPLHEKEGRFVITIAIGCTGGKHRSIVIAEEVMSKVREMGYNTYLLHRDIDAD